jgi:hypothetical protein
MVMVGGGHEQSCTVVEYGTRKSLTGSIAKFGLPAPKHEKKCQKPDTNDSFGDSI